MLEVSTQMNISDRRREESVPKVDADFFNRQGQAKWHEQSSVGCLWAAFALPLGCLQHANECRSRLCAEMLSQHLSCRCRFDDDFDTSDMKPSA